MVDAPFPLGGGSTAIPLHAFLNTMVVMRVVLLPRSGGVDQPDCFHVQADFGEGRADQRVEGRCIDSHDARKHFKMGITLPKSIALHSTVPPLKHSSSVQKEGTDIVVLSFGNVFVCEFCYSQIQ